MNFDKPIIKIIFNDWDIDKTHKHYLMGDQ